MAQIREKVVSVINGINDTLTKNGFVQVETKNENVFAFDSNKGSLKITFDDNKICLYSADGKYDELTDNDYKRIALSLIEQNSNESDIRYIVGDFSETINEKYSEKTFVKKNGYKNPPTVSRNAVKSGMTYDANTLVNRICSVYPELKPIYKRQIDEYGQVLADEFFMKYGNTYILETIKKNDPVQMKKLFNVLNEVYNDGSNEVMDIIAVTILGSLNNDTVLLANCVDFMDENMAPIVIAVNKYMATSAGKKALSKMETPPPYKPKKEKKSGIMSQLMSGGIAQQ